jgi:hypothetical protein
MDDIDMFATSECSIHAAIQEVQAYLSAHGQSLNEEKTSVEMLEANVSQSLSAIQDEGNFDNTDEDVDPIEELRQRAIDQDGDRVPFLIGGLRSNRDPRALRLLETYPWITKTFQKQSAKYLSAVGDEVTDRDREWIAERALETTTEDNVFEQARLAYVLRDLRALSNHGQQLFDKSRATDRSTHAVLSDALACAAATSQEKASIRSRRATEIGMELAEMNARRAHFVCLRETNLGQQAEHALVEVVKRDPDMRITANWLRCAGSR